MNDRRKEFELLRRFTRAGEQSAFGDLARRHLDLVFATALRKVGDSGAAQEVAQSVFAALARKAWWFAPDDSLPAWLHKTGLLQARFWLRGELRRRRREQTAAEWGTTMNTPEEQPAFADPVVQGRGAAWPASVRSGFEAYTTLLQRISWRMNWGWQIQLGCGSLRRVPRKIRQLVADLEHAGFALVPGGKGSHRKFRHPNFPGAVILSGQAGDDAHHYQEKQVRNAIRKASQ